MAARGAAWRRRQRRLRSMLRHERQTVAMELAAALHHSRGGLGMNVGLRAQKTASAGPAEFFDLFSHDGRHEGEGRPAALLEPRPQEGVQRHVVECAIEVFPFVQILDVPVPQVGDQLPNILHFFSTFSPDPEQVIEVPKFLPEDVSVRTVVRVEQLTEQLVEVPTNPGYALAVVASKLFSRREIRGILSGRGVSQGRGGEWCTWRSSRFLCWTEFNSVFGADR